MSSKSVGLDYEGDVPQLPTSQFDISIAIKKNGQWEVPDLSRKKLHSIQKAIATIKEVGDQQASPVFEKFNEESAVLELTENGVYVKVGQRWTNILDDQTVLGETRSRILKTLRGATSVLGDFTALKTKIEKMETVPEIEGKDQNIVIQVRVLSKAEQLAIGTFQQTVVTEIETLLDEERGFNLKTKQAQVHLQNSDNVNHLLQNGWTLEEIEEYRSRLNRLEIESNRALDLLEKTERQIASGQIDKGIGYFNQEISKHHGVYTQACIDLMIFQNRGGLSATSQQPPPSSLNLKQPIRYREVLQEIRTAADHVQEEYKQIIDQQEIASTLESINPHIARLEHASAEAVFFLALHTEYQTSRIYTKKVGNFVEKYVNNRELFESLMRNAGLSDLESAVVFNHFVETYRALEEWDNQFQVVIDLANQKKYQEALEAHHNLIHNRFKSFVAITSNAFYGIRLLSTPAVDGTLTLFADLMGIRDRTPLSVMLVGSRIPLKPQMIFKEILSKGQKAGLTPPKEVDKTLLMTEQTILEMNQKNSQFEALFSQTNDLYDFFNFGQLRAKHHPLHEEWRKMAVNSGWTETRMKQFTDLMNQYGELIQGLKEAERAIAIETNPQKKRALQRQFQLLLKQKTKKIKELDKKFIAFGGLQQLKTLITMAEEIGGISQKKGASKASKGLERLFLRRQQENPNFKYRTAQEMMEHLPRDIEQLPADERKVQESEYKQELLLINFLKFPTQIETEAKRLFGIMENRMGYIDNLLAEYEPLAVFQPHQVDQQFLKTAYLSEPLFLEILKKQGWSSNKIKQLDKWLDRYVKTTTPLSQAKVALDADPENPELQKEFKRVAEDLFPKINRLTREFSQQFVNLGNIANLEQALIDFQLISGQTEVRPNIFHTIEKINQTLIEASYRNDQPLSWDESYFKKQLKQLSSIFPTDRLWKSFLSENQISEQSLVQIERLFLLYQKHLHRIAILERRLEAHPEDDKLHKALKEELVKQREKLDQLEKTYVQLAETISKLDEAFLQYRDRLAEELTNPPPITDKRKEEISKKMQLIEQMSFREAFTVKREFMKQTYARFASL